MRTFLSWCVAAGVLFCASPGFGQTATPTATTVPPTATPTSTTTPGSAQLIFSGTTVKQGGCIDATSGRKTIQFVELADGATVELRGAVSRDVHSKAAAMLLATYTASSDAPTEITASYDCLFFNATGCSSCAYAAYMLVDE